MNVCLRRVHAASYNTNHIGGVMVKSARLECGRSWVRAPVGVIPKTIQIDMCCFSGKHAALRR